MTNAVVLGMGLQVNTSTALGDTQNGNLGLLPGLVAFATSLAADKCFVNFYDLTGATEHW